MDTKERQMLQAEYDRIERWLENQKRFYNPECIENVLACPEKEKELEEHVKRAYRRLNKIGKRLGYPEGHGLPWFQFYDMIEYSIRQYLPAKYQDYEVQIKTVEIEGQRIDVMKLWKEDDPGLPALQIGAYTERVSDGADAYCILGQMASEYKKLLRSERKHQMER